MINLIQSIICAGLQIANCKSYINAFKNANVTCCKFSLMIRGIFRQSFMSVTTTLILKQDMITVTHLSVIGSFK